MKKFDYFAFISYSHKDQKIAKRLKKRLQGYNLPSKLQKSYPALPKNLKPIFFDESNLVALGGSLQESLQKNLDNSNYLIVICSPNSAKSEYVNDEVKHFIEIGRKSHIVPLIIEGVPYSGGETECFPSALRNLPREEQLLGVDMTKFGERHAFLRVIASMLELNLDKFVFYGEKERKRKVIRLGSIAAAVVIMVGTIIWYSAYYMNKKRYESDAQLRRGSMYYTNHDYVSAVGWFEKAAANGNAEAQYVLGAMYYEGEMIEQDYTKAIEWFEKAATNGNAEAQYVLGAMYYEGEVIEQDYMKAIVWYKKAAANGVAEAQFIVGFMYQYGEGVERDYAKAMAYYKKAAAHGDASSQCMIGVMYLAGQGVKQDYIKAVEWFEKAAANGVAEAQYIIGAMYQVGEGVEQDDVKAKEWIERATVQVQGDVNAQERLKKLKKSLIR